MAIEYEMRMLEISVENVNYQLEKLGAQKMRRDEPITFVVLDRRCDTLDCDYVDIIEHVRDR